MFTKMQQAIISMVGDKNQPIVSLMIKRARSSAWMPVSLKGATRRELIGIVSEAFMDGKFVEYKGAKGTFSTAPAEKAKTTVEDVVSSLPINPSASYMLVSSGKDTFPAKTGITGSSLRDMIYEMNGAGYTAMSIIRDSDGYTHSFRLPKAVIAPTCEIEIDGTDFECWEIVSNDGSGKTVIGSRTLDLTLALKSSKAKLMGISWYPATGDNERAASVGDSMRKIWIVGTHTVKAVCESLESTVIAAKLAGIAAPASQSHVDVDTFKFARNNGNLFVKFADVSLISYFSNIMIKDIRICGTKDDVIEFLLGEEFTEETFKELLLSGWLAESSDVDSMFE